MIELQRHIEILLLNNDCVIVPGFGGFMAHYVEAKCDDAEGIFLPPLRTLGFNPQLRINDHLLVQSYIEAYDISYPEALRRIEDEVAELKQHLDNEGSFEMNDIGILSINYEGNIVFEPCEAGILTPSLYGLSSIDIKPIFDKSVKPKASAPVETVDEDNKEKAEILEFNFPEDNVEETDEKGDAIVIKMSWIRNIAAAAAAIILFFSLSTPLSNSIKTDEGTLLQSSVLPIITADAQEIAHVETTSADEALMESAEDSLADESKAEVSQAESITEQQPESAKTETAAKKTETIAKTEKSGPYTIVLASETLRHLAENFVESLKAKGFDGARIIEMANSNRVRVVYESFGDSESAHARLHELRHSGSEDFYEAWVLNLDK